MTATYLIGDLHLGHQLVSDIRGFSDVMEHDQAVLDSLREVLRNDDLTIFLGDLSSGSSAAERKALEHIHELRGRKRLIFGNHDSPSGVHRRRSPNMDLFREVFESMNDYGRIRVEDTTLLLSHFPYAVSGDGPGRGDPRYEQFRLPDMGGLLVHAHTHHTDPFNGSKTGRELCVSWDAWRRPVNMGDLSKWVKSALEAEKPEGMYGATTQTVWCTSCAGPYDGWLLERYGGHWDTCPNRVEGIHG